MRRSPGRIRSFTLIELLVVISIVAVLMGLAFPAFLGMQNAAKKTQAKNDLVQIVTAANAFYTEYGKYPVPSGTTDDGYKVGGQGGPSSGALFNALRGVELAGGAQLNPRQIVFVSPPDAKDQSNARNGIKTIDNQWYDPWGTPYALSLDANYDNQVPNPYSSNAGAGNIRAGVISLSLGKNQSGGAGDKNSASSKDDVISWQ